MRPLFLTAGGQLGYRCGRLVMKYAVMNKTQFQSNHQRGFKEVS